MGFFFSNLHIRKTEERSDEALKKALESFMNERGLQLVSDPAGADVSVYVYDVGGKWLSVCLEDFEFFTEDSRRDICKPLSDKLATDILTVTCVDSDCLILNRINSVQEVDSWLVMGDYPGIDVESTPEKWEGLVEDVSALKTILSEDFVFAEDALEQLEPVLGMEQGQGRFCGQLLLDEYFEDTQTFYFAHEKKKANTEPPRLEPLVFDLTPCKIGEPHYISVINRGGSSKGLAIAFSGSYVENEEITFRDVKLEYNGRNHREAVELEPKKLQTKDGKWIYYARVPEFVLQEGVKEGRASLKTMREEFKREFGVRFTPDGNARKILDITVHFLPLGYPKGQCAWCVWHRNGSKRAFIEQYNRIWGERQAPGVKLLDPDDFDLD